MERLIDKALLAFISILLGMGFLYLLQILEDQKHEFVFVMVVAVALIVGYSLQNDKP